MIRTCVSIVVYVCLAQLHSVHGIGILSNIQGCLDPNTVDYNHDYFTDKVSPAYSKYWNVSYHKTYKIVYNKKQNFSYLLYQCGSKPPSSEVGRHTATFVIPHQAGVIITETDQITPLEQLDLRLKIQAFVGDPSYMASPCLQKLRDDKNLTILANNYYPQGEDLTQYILENPNVIIFDSYFGDTALTYPNNTLVVSAFYESSSIAKYEWAKLYSVLFNEEATANSNFNSALSRYLCTSSNAAYLQQKDATPNEKPTVLWAYYLDYGNEKGWDVGECDRKFHYYCEYAKQCSTNLLTSSNGSITSAYYPGQRYMTDEEFFEFGKNASYWIYPGNNWDQVYNLLSTKLSQFASVKNNQVFDILGSGYNAWFEEATVEFDIVLQDFCSVVKLYDEANITYTRKYLRKVLPTAEPVGTLGTCSASDLSKPWDTRAATCTFLSSQKTSSSPVTPMLWVAIGTSVAGFLWLL